jgi:hypothetical protein
MGPMPLRPKLLAQGLSAAIIWICGLGPAAHAQVSSNTDSTAMPIPGARTQSLTYGVDAGVGESDNVTLVSNDKVSQTIAIADVDFALKEQTRLLQANATGDFSDLNYLQGAYGNQFLGRFDGLGRVALVPGRLFWVVSDDFGQAAIDPYTPTTPTNLEQVNYFSTGPDLSMTIGGVNFINASARYSRTQYQTSPFNSNRLSASLDFGHDVSAGAAISVNGQFERVMFSNTELNSDFDRSSGFGRYELHGARTDLVVDVGVTSIRQGAPPESEATTTESLGDGIVPNAGLSPQATGSTTGGLVKVQLTRKLSAAASLTLTAGRELTDAAASFSTLQSGSAGGATLGAVGNGSTPAAQTSSSYTDNSASVRWQYLRNRTAFTLDARWEKDNYPGEPLLDVSRPSAGFSVKRRLTRALRVELIGRWYKSDYSNVVLTPAESQFASANYNDWQVGGSLIWRYGRWLEVRLRGYHDSHDVVTGAGGYGEDRVFLTVGYRPSSGPGADQELTQELPDEPLH